MSLTRATQTTGASPAAALTTPFAPPTGCADKFLLTTSLTSTRESNNTSTSSVWTVFASAPGASGFADCQPSEWDPTDKWFSFSPAVCPSAWTAYDIRQDSNGTWGAECCSRGFSYYRSLSQDIYGIPSSACVKVIANNMTTSARTSTYTFTFGTVVHKNTNKITTSSGISTLLVHNAWHIYWDPTDVVSLSPTPPIPLCSTSAIYTWVPGESLLNGTYLGNECENRGSDMGSVADWGVYGFLVIGLPVILGVLLIGGFAFIIYSYSKKKRLERGVVWVVNQAAIQTMQDPESQTKAAQPSQEAPPMQLVGGK